MYHKYLYPTLVLKINIYFYFYFVFYFLHFFPLYLFFILLSFFFSMLIYSFTLFIPSFSISCDHIIIGVSFCSLFDFLGHTEGILSVSWCPTDPSLLMSCGKDNKTMMWDLLHLQPVYDLPSGTVYDKQTRRNLRDGDIE